MRKPPRPAPVVAAAVLLIVVGSELILGGIAGAGWLWLVIASVEACTCCGAWLFAFGFVIGINFLASGIDALTGNLVDPVRASKPVLVVGGIAGALSLLTLGCCIWTGYVGRTFERATFTSDDGMLVAGVLLLWSNTAILLTAGVLLHRNARTYLLWRELLRRPREDAGYEPEGEE